MVELRKRPPPKEPAAPAPPAKKGRAASSSKSTKSESSIASKAKTAASKVKKAVAGPLATDETIADVPSAKPEAVVEKGETGLIPETAGTAPSTTTVPALEPEAESERPPATEDLEKPPEKANIDSSPVVDTTSTEATLPLNTESVGKLLSLAGLPTATLQTHTGRSLQLKDLLAGDGKGIIVFTYPRASTPGCTTQVCLFRDNHETFTGPSNGYKIYGLSTDSVKANANFATKQKIQYELLCDPDAALTGAIGMKKPGNAKGTLRGVVVIEKDGKVRVWCQAGPARTVEVVKEFLATAHV